MKKRVLLVTAQPGDSLAVLAEVLRAQGFTVEEGSYNETVIPDIQMIARDPVPKRDLFAEIREGFDELREDREASQKPK
jgi:hypothetical protein